MYDPKSAKADEFICHQEVLETLEYAEKNKNNVELIESIIEKARLRKGLSHRDAAVLLDCEIEEKNKEIFALAEQIKKVKNFSKSKLSFSVYLNKKNNPCRCLLMKLKRCIANYQRMI